MNNKNSLKNFRMEVYELLKKRSRYIDSCIVPSPFQELM